MRHISKNEKQTNKQNSIIYSIYSENTLNENIILRSILCVLDVNDKLSFNLIELELVTTAILWYGRSVEEPSLIKPGYRVTEAFLSLFHSVYFMTF